jgi:hypothetical protein
MDTLLDLCVGATTNELPKTIIFNPWAIRGTKFTICIIIFLLFENIYSFVFEKNLVVGNLLLATFLILYHRLSESISLMPHSFIFNGSMTIFTIKIIKRLTTAIQLILLNFQWLIHWNLSYFPNNLILRTLRKCFIYQTFLRIPIHDSSCFECSSLKLIKM